MSTGTPVMEATGSPSARPVILIADDSRVMRVALKKILRDEYDVIESVDGEDAWSKLISEPSVQIVFSDLSMPELDGFGLLARIRKSDDDRVRDLPFIVITGNEDDDGMRERAVACGANDLVTKPFQSVEIKTRAKAYIKHRSELIKASETIEATRIDDAITGLANEKYFMKRATEDVAYSIRHKRPFAVFYMQLSNLKEISKKYGVQAANETLKSVAKLLLLNTRTEDTIGFFGNARFVLMLPCANAPGSTHLAKRIMLEIAAMPVQYDGDSIVLSSCMGICSPDISPDLELKKVIETADQRLAKAEKSGGNCLLSNDNKKLITLEDIMEELAIADMKNQDVVESKISNELTSEISVFKSVIEDLQQAIKDKESEMESFVIEKDKLEETSKDSDYQIVRLKAELSREENSRRVVEEKVELERLDLETQKRELEGKQVEELNKKLAEEESVRVKVQFDLHSIQKEKEALSREIEILQKYGGLSSIGMRIVLAFKIIGNKIFGFSSSEDIEQIKKRLEK